MHYTRSNGARLTQTKKPVKAAVINERARSIDFPYYVEFTTVPLCLVYDFCWTSHINIAVDFFERKSHLLYAVTRREEEESV